MKRRFTKTKTIISKGRIDILKTTQKTFSAARASQAAAGLAYYAIFSLFPLLLVLIAGGSYFLNVQQIYQNVAQFMQSALPVSPELINNNLRQVLDARGTVSMTGLLMLLWSASGFFTSLAYNINLAWSDAPERDFWKKRLVGFGIMAGLIGLLILSLVLGWIASLMPFLKFEIASSSYLNWWRLASNLSSWLMIFLLFLLLYRLVPASNVNWSAAIWGAITSSILWKISTAGFGWYVRSGLGRYQVVYGSLGAIVALLFLIFILSFVALFGAHLCSAVDRWQKNNETASWKGD